MANSYEITVASGATAIVNVPFPYIKEEHVHVYKDGVEVDQSTLVWTSPSTIELPSTPTVGTTIKVRRITPSSELLVIWENPSALDANQLNLANLHVLYVAQEAYDLADTATGGLEELVTYLDQIAAYYNQVTLLTSQVEQATALAQQWASEATGVPVVPGQYSAKHWASVAAAIVGVTALGVPFTPGGGLSSTNVQAALVEAGNKITALGSTNIRERLTADRTYYVRTNGSDSNNGLANTAGGAFLTLQKAVNIALGTLDADSHTVTIKVADGTYSRGATIPGPLLGNGKLVIEGNGATPANVKIQTTVDLAAIYVTGHGAKVTAQYLQVKCVGGGGIGLYAENGGVIEHKGISFDACSLAHCYAFGAGSLVQAIGDEAIVGASTAHYWADSAGRIEASPGNNMVLSGTLNFGYAFATAGKHGLITAQTVSIYGGTISGVRWYAASGGIIDAGGRGANVFPGNVAGFVVDWGAYY